MHILYHHRTQGGGAEGVHIREVIKALGALGHKVTVVSPPGVDPFSPDHTLRGKKSTKTSLKKRIVLALPQFVFEILEIGYNFWAYGRLKRQIKAGRPDLIYERYSFFCRAGLSVARKFKIPFILEVNEISGLKRQRPQAMKGLCRWFEKRVFAGADALIVVSRFLKEQLAERGVVPGKIHVIPNAVNVKDFEAGAQGGEARKRHGWGDKCVVAFVGMFSHWDRLEEMLSAFKDVHERLAGTHFLIVGEGTQRPGLMRQAEALGLADQITFTGEMSRGDVPRLIEACDIGVLYGSNPFGSPIALFEYMVMAKPVVAPRYEPTEAVIEHGSEGFLFEPGNREAFVRAVLSLAQDRGLRELMGRRARQKVLEHHTWEKNALKVVKMAEELAGARKTQR